MPYVPSRCLFFLTVLIQNRSNSFPPINIFIINILTYVQEDVFSKFPVAWLLHFSFVMTLLSASVFLKNRGGKENIFSKLEIYWLTALPKQKVLLKNFNLFCFFHNKNMFYWIPLWSKRTSGSALLRRQESPPPIPPIRDGQAGHHHSRSVNLWRPSCSRAAQLQQGAKPPQAGTSLISLILLIIIIIIIIKKIVSLSPQLEQSSSQYLN